MTRNYKMLLLTLIVILKTSFAGLSQNTDTICLPIATAQKVLSDAKQKPILVERINLLTTDISLLQERIANLKTKDSLNTQVVATYEAQLYTMQEQRKIFEDQLKTYEKLIRRQKRKTFFTGMAGIVTTAITFYIATK